MFVRTSLAAAVVLVVPLAACGGGDDEPAAAEAGETAGEESGESGSDGEAVGAEGDGDTGTGAGESGSVGNSDRPDSLREEYPIPIAPGWEVDVLGEIGMSETAGVQLLYPEDAYDDMVAFYDEWFESQPEEYGRSVIGEDVVYQLLGGTYYTVNIAPGYEERGRTWVTLLVAGDNESN